jgi:aminoglycoside 3-N-acetyltransferase
MSGAPTLTRQGIVAGLKALGVKPGCVLLVHASLSSLGTVKGGADTVIAALLEVLGPDGTLLMPTHPARDGRVFDPATVPSAMGRISETFRQRPGVLRSRHPFHPVAACGPLAVRMLQGHECSSIPDGPNSPYGRLISLGGYVLHIGCDLDTLTLVHAVEAELGLPFLRELDMDYLGEDGQVHRLHLTRCPGGHRGGVLKFDRLFRQQGAMAVGRIGQAVCRLIAAHQAAQIMRHELECDPFFVLDDNPHCADCTRFRGKIKTARLAREDFQLTTLLYHLGEDLEQTLDLVQSEGIAAVEIEAAGPGGWKISPDGLCRRLEQRGMRAIGLRARGAVGDIAGWFRVAAELGAEWVRVSLPMPSPADTAWQDDVRKMLAAGSKGLQLLLAFYYCRAGANPTPTRASELAQGLAALGSPRLGVSYNPADIARNHGSPFYGELYAGPLRRFVRHVELQDAVAGSDQLVPLGQGNAEIAEIISGLRCRSYSGCLCLWPPPEQSAEAFRQAAAAFWHIMDHI